MSERTPPLLSPGDVTPPQSPEAERSVLGALMQDPGALNQATETLQAEDFYEPRHQAIYQAAQTLAAQASAVDLVTMDARLSKTGALEGIGGTEYLVALIQFVPTTVNIRHYINIVLEKSTLRKLIAASQEITRNSYRQHDELDQILAGAEKSIFDIVMRRSGGGQLKPISEVIRDTYAQIEELDKNKGQIMGVPTGFSRLDWTLTGLHAGELVLVGARPSMGKTAFAANIAFHAASKGHAVAIFSLEMPREQIALRILCSEARVSTHKVRSGSLRTKDWVSLAKVVPLLASMRLYIDDTSSLTPSQLRSRCRRLMMEKGLDLIVVDYLQLMSTDGRAENRQNEVSEISRKLKSIALELKVPLLACAQLSRAPVQRASKRPILSDLRDSGSIEQDADVVVFLHRESYYEDADEDDDTAEVIIAKQRNGPLDTVRLHWLDEYTRFEDMYEQQGG